LKKHEWDEKTKKLLLDDAQAGLTRLEQRVENILQNNRLISGKEMTKVLFDAEEVVTRVMHRHQVGPYQGRIIELKNDCDAGAQMEGDADALALAWGNLLENALKYSPSDQSLYPLSFRRVTRGFLLFLMTEGPAFHSISEKMSCESSSASRIQRPRELDWVSTSPIKY
jgi:signal transduction histidine kinase